MKKRIKKITGARSFKYFVILGISAILILSYIFYQDIKDRVFIDNSLIDMPIISLSPQAPEKLLTINVYEGQKVKKGDILAVVGTESLVSYQDGLVVKTDKEIGSMITSQTPVVSIANLHDARVAGTIDENKGLNLIKVGDAVSFTVDALPGKTYWGYVDEVSPSAKQTQLSFSISSERPTQQFVVYAKFDSLKYPEIANGMSAKMVVYTNTH